MTVYTVVGRDDPLGGRGTRTLVSVSRGHHVFPWLRAWARGPLWVDSTLSGTNPWVRPYLRGDDAPGGTVFALAAGGRPLLYVTASPGRLGSRPSVRLLCSLSRMPEPRLWPVRN